MSKRIALLLIAIISFPLAGNAWKGKVTKGAPAKGPSNLDFSETVEDRKQSLGKPAGEKKVMQADATRNVKAISAVQDAEQQDKICTAKVQDLIMADPKCLNRVDREGRTMLHQAAFAGYANTVKFLLKRGADTTLRDHAGSTAAQLARLVGREDIASAIEAYKP